MRVEGMQTKRRRVVYLEPRRDTSEVSGEANIDTKRWQSRIDACDC